MQGLWACGRQQAQAQVAAAAEAASLPRRRQDGEKLSRRSPGSLAEDSGSDNAEVGGLSEQEMTQIDHATRVSELDAEAAAEA